MFTNKFATRLNSFQSNWHKDEKPSIRDLIDRASKVEGLTHVDLNYPDHGDPSIREISNFSNEYRLGTANTDANYNIAIIRSDAMIIHSEDFLKTEVNWFK